MGAEAGASGDARRGGAAAREVAGTGAEAGVRDGMVGLGWWEVKNSSDDLEYKLVLF